MPHRCFEDLPARLRTYVNRFGWTPAEIEDWIHAPIPALAGKSILQALDDGEIEKVTNVVLRVGDAVGVTSALPDES